MFCSLTDLVNSGINEVKRFKLEISTEFRPSSLTPKSVNLKFLQ